MRLGNGRWGNTSFNARLQPTQIGLGTSATNQSLLKLNYDYGTTDNNGNVKSQQISFQGLAQQFVQTYQYDSLNRLKSAVETQNTAQTWKQTFTFDRYGNRRFDTTNNNTTTLLPNCPVAVCNPEINPQNNRLSSPGWQYDAEGNTVQDAEGRSFIYDGENKQTEVRNAQNQTIGKYYFDGDGKRVKKIVPAVVNGGAGETTVFVYDASARLVAEYSTIVEPQSTGKISYLTQDHLGSPRILTDQNGAVISRRDFAPYGEELGVDIPLPTGTNGQHNRTTAQGYVGADSIRQKFTGYERDAETDLDFAQARMYVNRLGRYLSVDPILMNSRRVVDPQQINRYVYVRNNPLKYIDLLGEDLFLANAHARESVNRLFGGMTAAERDRIVVSEDGKVTIKPCASCTGTPSSAFKVVSDAVSADYVIRISLVKPGESVIIADGTKVPYQTVADARGQAYEFTDKSWDVVIPDGEFTVPGIEREFVTTDVTTMTPHEIGHAVEQDAIAIENAVRRENGLLLRDPDAHIERDHNTGGIRQTVSVKGRMELIEIKDPPSPDTRIQPRPLQPLPTPPPTKKPEDRQ